MAEQPAQHDNVTPLEPAVVRRRGPGVRAVGTALVTAVTVAYGAYWVFDRLSHVMVVDARIATSMILVSSRVPGWITDFRVDEGDEVSVGVVLLEIDSRDARHKLKALEASLGGVAADIARARARGSMVDQQTASRLEAQQSRLDAARSALLAAASQLEMQRAEWERATPLREREIMTQQEWEEDRNRYQLALQLHRQARAEVGEAEAALHEADADRSELSVIASELEMLNLKRDALAAERDRQRNQLEDHAIKSPVNGVIDETFVNPGEYVAPGQRILVMHDPSSLWVKANVKETDIRHLREGKKAEITVDAFPDATFEGTITRLGQAATSQFALLPNANPSGNFTKITQRLEVRIDLDRPDDRLKPGMMVEVRVPK